MPLAAFIGIDNALPIAFPPSLRKEIAKYVEIHPVELNLKNWDKQGDSLHNVEILLATWGVPPMSAEFLKTLPNLKAIFYAAGSIKCFATDEAYSRGITICAAAGANAIPVAEYTTSTVLLSLKKFWHYAAQTRTTQSWHRSIDFVPGAYHSTVGLVSLGAVGRSVAQMLGRFDIDLIAFDPFLPREQAEELNTELVSLEDLFRRSDVVSIHTPWLKETENLINERLFRLMKPGATFINTSRGAIVNENDLIQVFKERPDLTAVLDVTWPEPPAKDSPLFTLPNVVLTPHIAGSMGTEITRMGRWMTDDLIRFLNHKPLQYNVTHAMLARMA
jgi:phosphoglycerate dehydrogenase-like enzyme